MTIDHYQAVEDAFREGRIESQDSDTLRRYLIALSNRPIENDRVRHRDIIRGLTLNHVLLQRHIAALDKKNSKTTWLVVVLTIAALIGTASQTWYGYKADKRAEAESAAIEAKRQTQESQSAARSPSLPQGSDLAIARPSAPTASGE